MTGGHADNNPGDIQQSLKTSSQIPSTPSDRVSRNRGVPQHAVADALLLSTGSENRGTVNDRNSEQASSEDSQSQNTQALSDANSEAPTRSPQDELQKLGGPVRQFYGELHKRSKFVPGLVISAAFHTVEIWPIRTLNTTDTTVGPVFSKIRKLVIIDTKFKDHCIVLPIFTLEGKGLEGRKNKDEYVGIRDSKTIDPPPSRSKYPSIVSHRVFPFEDITKGFHFMSSKAYIQVSHPVIFRYGSYCIIEAKVLQPDLGRLTRIYQDTLVSVAAGDTHFPALGGSRPSGTKAGTGTADSRTNIETANTETTDTETIDTRTTNTGATNTGNSLPVVPQTPPAWSTVVQIAPPRVVVTGKTASTQDSSGGGSNHGKSGSDTLRSRSNTTRSGLDTIEPRRDATYMAAGDPSVPRDLKKSWR
ncbi:hypothetical protein B7494_g2199 [Chlorociboria aeruginascens]|nr:hypothetical protein B7494_g2199 [Chlorociboria aeruginascens]